MELCREFDLLVDKTNFYKSQFEYEDEHIFTNT
jgi:hypothetical protein